MDLKITSYNNFFKIKGTLNKSNLYKFQNEFENICDRLDAFTISIEDVESMDKYGVKAFTQLHKYCVTKNKRMAIIGYGCKDLYNHFQTEDFAA